MASTSKTTTVKSTALDFDSIKNNLKTFLANKDEFKDYNFEASGLSNILDVLAYNTHFNGLIANFALNESFISTAQLRSSIVSLAEGIGYVPDSKTSAQATVKLSTSLAGVSGRPSQIQIPSGFKFTATVDDEDYVFQTQENLTGVDDGFGLECWRRFAKDQEKKTTGRYRTRLMQILDPHLEAFFCYRL